MPARGGALFCGSRIRTGLAFRTGSCLAMQGNFALSTAMPGGYWQ